MNSSLRLPISLLLTLALSGCFFFPSNSPSHAQLAADLRAEGKFAEAIEEYRAHIAVREAIPTRPADENPSFYLILIGDIELQRGDRIAAREAYAAARVAGVGKELVGDRFRQLAEVYANEKEYETAIAILKEGRELDPLLFDISLDELHKRSLQEEDGSSNPLP